MINNYGKRNEENRDLFIEKNLLSIEKEKRILDAGAGTQKYKKYCSHLEYVSQDFAKYNGRGDNVALQVENFDYGELNIVSDITEIPEENNSFDVILCSEVLEHIPRPDLAIKEFSRLLKKNGKLILTAPFCSLTHFSPFHFFTGFNIYWYENILPLNGFKIEYKETNGSYFEYLAQELYRLPYVMEQYVGAKLTDSGIDLVNGVLNILHSLDDAKENKSNELLNFGYHIIAKKIN